MTRPKTISENFEGLRFGSLEVKSFAGYFGGEFKHANWETQCDCGKFRRVRGTDLKRGTARACGTCARTAASRRGADTRRKPREQVKLRSKLYTYRENARRKGHEVAITDERMSELMQSPCAYCGEESGLNGIDRADNTRGYTPENSVSCCMKCNYAKRDMTLTEFKAWVIRVYSHVTGEGRG